MDFISILVYTIGFCLVRVIPRFSMVFFLTITAYNIFLYTVKPKKTDTALISSLLIGNELLCMVNVFGYIIIKALRHSQFKRNKLKRKDFLALVIVLSNSLISAIYYDGIFNFIFYCIYLIMLLITVQGTLIEADNQKLYKIIQAFTFIELVVTGIIALTQRSLNPGDSFGGSMLNAHFFANWLIISFFVSIQLIKEKKKCGATDIFTLVALATMLYLASANAVTLSAVIAVILYFIINLGFHKKKWVTNDIFWMIIFSYIGFYVFLAVMFAKPIESFLSAKSELLRLFFYTPGYNYKIQYFQGTLFDSLNGLRLFIGYGLGQYGSRMANAFAYNTMWRSPNAFNNFIATFFSPHCVPQYAKYVSFYDKNFVDIIQWRSAILSYPFSSFIALIAETGIIGVYLFARTINKYFKNSRCKIIIYYFLIACIFDIYFDNFQCISALIIYLNVMGYNRVRKNV